MEIITDLKDSGLKFQANILDSLKKNSIVIRTSSAREMDFDLGDSKIGGMPHLPADFEWPYYFDKPLTFIAQFNLSKIAAYDTEDQLPDEGFLLFFYEGSDEVCGMDPMDKGGFKVFYFDISADSLMETFPPSGTMPLNPCALSFRTESSYPLDENLILQLDEDELEDFYQLDVEKSELYENIAEKHSPLCEEGVHRILGYPDLLLGEIFTVCQLASNGYFSEETDLPDEAYELLKSADEWTLLFQMDSDDNCRAMWGDCGMIYFAIKRDDLRNRNFDNVWAVFQCLG
jgi:uncharacterized protein YwqG